MSKPEVATEAALRNRKCLARQPRGRHDASSRGADGTPGHPRGCKPLLVRPIAPPSSPPLHEQDGLDAKTSPGASFPLTSSGAPFPLAPPPTILRLVSLESGKTPHLVPRSALTRGHQMAGHVEMTTSILNLKKLKLITN
jgi:hypothetical protein